MNSCALETSSKSPLQFKNKNFLWGSIIAETLWRSGIEKVVFSPGSRSTPIILGLNFSNKIDLIPILDERCAGFFALGLAKKSGKAVGILCTSGSAVANLFPAIVEAKASGIPLIVMTADRPAHAHHCGERQTMDQIKIFGDQVQYFQNLPEPSTQIQTLKALRQSIVTAHREALKSGGGPVHLNIPFDEPLEPCAEADFNITENELDWDHFFNGIDPAHPLHTTHFNSKWINEWSQTPRGLIIAGNIESHHKEEYIQSLKLLSKHLGWPIFADVLSPARHFNDHFPNAIEFYDAILRNPSIFESLQPEIVIQFGTMPISKVLLKFLKESNSNTYIYNPGLKNIDHLHRNSQIFWINSKNLEQELKELYPQYEVQKYCNSFKELNEIVKSEYKNQFQPNNDLIEGQIQYLLSKYLPENTSIFSGVSLVIRDNEFFWESTNKEYAFFCNRGLNGIDGNISTALGISAASEREKSVAIVGDLTFLHDHATLLNHPYIKNSLTIIVINNNGGRIFEYLPTSKHIERDTFERCFITEQKCNLEKIAESHGIKYKKIQTNDEFIANIQPLIESGIQILELIVDGNECKANREFIFKKVTEKMQNYVNSKYN